MPNLDDLVKLASIGTSGICIFGIFWTGWLIKTSSNSDNKLFHKSLLKYMNMVIIIAIVSGGTGIANAYIKQTKINGLEQQNVSLKKERNKLIVEKEIMITKVNEARNTFGIILQSKDAYQLRNPSEELKSHIGILKSYLDTQEQ